MLKIGAFARLTGVSVRLLHHYDALGLLSPALVDRASGYRYYAADQAARLHRILALKDLGLSLEQVAVLLSDPLPAEALRGMLRLKQAELRQHVSEAQARLDRVEQRLKVIEQEGMLPEIEVIVKPVAAQPVLSLRRALAFDETPHRVFYAASAALRAHGLRDHIQTILCRYHTLYLMQTYGLTRPRRSRAPRSLIEVAYVLDVALDRPVPVEDGGRRLWLRPRQFPAVETMACTVHCGSDRDRGLAHRALHQWASAHGYALADAVREVYLWRGTPGETSDEHVTEIQHPVRRVDARPAD